MASSNPPAIGADVDVREAISEKAAFTTEKYHGFPALMAAVARGAGNRLSFGDSLPVSFEFTEAQELRPELFLDLKSDDALSIRIRFEAIDTPGILVLPRPVFFRWYETMLGGARIAESIYPERDLTSLETEAAIMFARRLCDILLASLVEIGTVTAAQIVPTGEEEDISNWVRRNAQLCACFDASAGDVSGEMLLVLPFRLTEPMRQSPPEEPQPRANRSDPRWETSLRSTVEHTPLKLRAVLGNKMMNLGQIVSLQVGQVIDLECGIREPVAIEADGAPLFRGFLGKAEGKFMLKYDGLIEKEQAV